MALCRHTVIWSRHPTAGPLRQLSQYAPVAALPAEMRQQLEAIQ